MAAGARCATPIRHYLQIHTQAAARVAAVVWWVRTRIGQRVARGPLANLELGTAQATTRPVASVPKILLERMPAAGSKLCNKTDGAVLISPMLRCTCEDNLLAACRRG